MKIMLAMPTWTEDLGKFSRVGKTRNPQVPLGLLYLATLAEKKGHTVEFVDCDVEGVLPQEVAQRADEGRFDLLGLSATSPIFHKAVLTADLVKQRCPHMQIIIGGEHVNILKKEVFFDVFDFAAFGETEETWPEFLDRLESTSDDYSDINGLIWRENGNVVQNPPRRLFPNMDELPMPAIHLTNLDQYQMTFALPKNRKTGKYVSVMMTRGCPFQCTFCSESSAVKYGGAMLPMRFRSPENIVEELERHFKDFDVRHFFFMDSNITIRKSHITAMCEEIIRRDLPITFEGWTRANLVNDKLMALMKRAGLIRMSIGVESGDSEILRIIKKEVAQEDVRNAFRLMGKYEVEPVCSAMLGNPGETRKSIQRTIAFLDSIPELLYTNFSICNPYPGTEMLKWCREGKHGLRLRYDELSKYTRYDDSPIEVNDLTAKDLVRYQQLGLLKIHSKPRRAIAAMRMIGLGSLAPVVGKMFFNQSRNVAEAAQVMNPFRKSKDGLGRMNGKSNETNRAQSDNADDVRVSTA